jgi:hypothetical protein
MIELEDVAIEAAVVDQISVPPGIIGQEIDCALAEDFSGKEARQKRRAWRVLGGWLGADVGFNIHSLHSKRRSTSGIDLLNVRGFGRGGPKMKGITGRSTIITSRFPTPEEIAEDRGISKTRLEELRAIVEQGSKRGSPGTVAKRDASKSKKTKGKASTGRDSENSAHAGR